MKNEGNPHVQRVITHKQTDPMTLAELLEALQTTQALLSSAAVPILFEGKEIKNLTTNICKDDKGNYYVEVEIK